MARHVLKNNQVQFAGSFQLNMDATSRPALSPPTASPTPQAASRPVRARITETSPEFALVEVTCSCGQVTLVRCEYAAHAAPVPVGAAQG
jgi:hypothetical protein